MVEVIIDPAGGLQSIVLHGTVTAEELLGAWRQLIDDPAYDPSRNGLVDMTKIERMEFSYPAVSALNAVMHLADKQQLFQRIAVIAPRDELYGIGRMYAQLRAQGFREIEVFRDRENAFAWLGSDGA